MAFRLFRFRRFSSQVLLLVAGLIAVVQLAVYGFITRANQQTAIEHIEQNLQVGARLFRENLANAIERLVVRGKVLSNDDLIRPQLRQDPIDTATLSSILASYAERVDTPVIMLFSPTGELYAKSSPQISDENLEPFRYLIRTATERDMAQASGYTYLNGKLSVLVIVPHYAPYPEVHAWFALTYPIDAAFALGIKRTTGLDATFTSNPEEANLRVLTSTLPPAVADAVAHLSKTDKQAVISSEIVKLSNEPYVVHFEPLELLGESPARITLQRSLTAELAPARELQNMVLLISLLALAAATLAALWIARGVSQPLQQLSAHTDFVAAGDYTRRIDLPREDELGQLANAFNHMTAGLAERDKVRDLLGKVVSPEIATQLLQSEIQLGGEEREVTILFCDLRSFTTLSEKISPSELLTLLNRYLDRMSTIIERHGGVIDKYIGDAIMALFGAPVAMPDGAARALAAARAMVDALADLNRELALEGKPPLAFGVGINTGRVIAGNMGSKTRLNYTVLGDGVNLASRLESITKDYRTAIVVSESTARAAGEFEKLRPLGAVTVKGKTEPVKIYTLAATAAAAATDEPRKE